MRIRVAVVVGVVFALGLLSFRIADAKPPSDKGPESRTSVYTAKVTGEFDITGGKIVVEIPAVPPGRYIVTATTDAGDRSGVSNFVQCGLIGPSDPESTRTSLNANGWAALAAHTVTEITEVTDFALFCNTDGAAVVRSTQMTLLAVS